MIILHSRKRIHFHAYHFIIPYLSCSIIIVFFRIFSGRAIGIPEKVQPFPGQKLRDCLEHNLRQRGLIPSTVLFFVENSRTPLPDNCDANFLSGQRIVARGNLFHGIF